MLHALVSLKKEGRVPPCEIWVVAAADEEYSYRGVVKLCEGLQATAGVVAEPTDLRLAIASKGVLRWRICCRGKAAHSSKPHLGISAITNMRPGEDIPAVLAHYQGLLDAHPEWGAYMEPPMLEDYALDTPAATPLVSCASGILGDMGLPSEPIGVPYGSDASKLSRAGVPSFIFGPGNIDQAHAAVEWVECEQVERTLEFYRELMLQFE
jgi:acetylornithine deacetylase